MGQSPQAPQDDLAKDVVMLLTTDATQPHLFYDIKQAVEVVRVAAFSQVYE